MKNNTIIFLIIIIVAMILAVSLDKKHKIPIEPTKQFVGPLNTQDNNAIKNERKNNVKK